MKVQHSLKAVVLSLALMVSSTNALAQEESSHGVGLRLWAVTADADSNSDESGTLTSIYYDYYLSEKPYFFTSKFGFGEVGDSLMDIQLGFVRYWPSWAIGGGYHVIDYSQSFSISGGIEDGRSTSLGLEHGPELLGAYVGEIPDSPFGYRVSLTWVPILFTEDDNGSSFTLDGGITYTRNAFKYAVGYRRQSVNSHTTYGSEVDTVYSGVYAEAGMDF